MATTFYPLNQGDQIMDGPSKFDLMLSLFKKGEKISFSTIVVGKKITFLCFIIGIKAEDGTREKWIVEGHTFDTNKQIIDAKVKLYFDSKYRTGAILEHTKI